MLRIRMIEEAIAKKYQEQKMRCPVHLSIGQEAAAVGVCSTLKPEDKVVSTHRGHAHYLAKGGSLKGLISELYGKKTGCSKGMGGSMHLLDLSCNFYGSTSIVAGTIPYGVGLAFADKFKGSNAKTVIFFGDAAVEQGAFHEAANFASLHELNVLFVCENNDYSCYTHITKRRKRPGHQDGEFKLIAEGHGLLYFCSLPSIEHIAFTAERRSYLSFLEIPTFRHLEHCGPNNDDHLAYRDPEYISEWRKRDQVVACQHSWIAEIEAEINEAFVFAESSPDAQLVSAYAD